jgi:hypothetical protein
MTTPAGTTARTRLAAGATDGSLRTAVNRLPTPRPDSSGNVTDPEFCSLRDQFETLYQQVAEWSEQVAGFVDVFGGDTRPNSPSSDNAVHRTPGPEIGRPADDKLSKLRGLHEAMIAHLSCERKTYAALIQGVGPADCHTGLI